MQSCWVGWEEGGLHLGSQIERLNPWKPSASGEEQASHGVDLLLAAGGLHVLSAPAICSLGLAGGRDGADTRSPSFKNKRKIKKEPDATRGSRYSCSVEFPPAPLGGHTTVLSLQLSQTVAASRSSVSTVKSLDPHVLAEQNHIPSLTSPSEQLDRACWKAWEALLRPQGHWDPLREKFPNAEEPLEGLRVLQRDLSPPRVLTALATREVRLQKQLYSHQKWDGLCCS